MTRIHECDDADAAILLAAQDFTAQWKVLEASEAYLEYYGSDLEKLQRQRFRLIATTPARNNVMLAVKARIALLTQSDEMLIAVAEDAAAMTTA